jgi:hypothetical protein
MMSPLRELETFLSNGGSVCPHAPKTERIYVDFEMGPMIIETRRFIDTVGQTPNAALIVLAPKSVAAEFPSIRDWARGAFLLLARRFFRLSGATELEVVGHIERVRSMLIDDACPTRPRLSYLNEPIFAICMAPIYPKTHPRYAPHPIIVVTWQRDVAAVHERTAAQLSDVYKREHGYAYDADELMLELPLTPHQPETAK